MDRRAALAVTARLFNVCVPYQADLGGSGRALWNGITPLS